jgi:hypothetical protein
VTKISKAQAVLLALSVVLIVFGLLFVLTAARIVPVFPAFYNISHLILQYVIVIATMSAGIMLFANVAAGIKNKNLRNGMTLGITVFASILTLPLVYVFVSLFPAMNGRYDAFGEFMVKDVALDFQSVFRSDALQYGIYTLGTLLSVVFLAEPILSCVLTLKNKTLRISPKGIRIVPLPAAENKAPAKEKNAA